MLDFKEPTQEKKQLNHLLQITWAYTPHYEWAGVAHFLQNCILHVRPAKIQISLHIRAVWSESSQGNSKVARDPNHLQALRRANINF